MSVSEEQLLRIFPLLEQVLIKIGVHRTPTGASLGLTNLQMGVLGSVARRANSTVGEVALDRMVVRPAASRLVNELVKKGLLRREHDQQDRRVVRLHLTAEGERALVVVHAEAMSLLGQVLEHMAPDDQTALLKGLESFVRAVMALEETS